MLQLMSSAPSNWVRETQAGEELLLVVVVVVVVAGGAGSGAGGSGSKEWRFCSQRCGQSNVCSHIVREVKFEQCVISIL